MLVFHPDWLNKYTEDDYCLRENFWDGDRGDKRNCYEEALLYDILSAGIDKHYYIFPHVSLGAIFEKRHSWMPFFKWACLTSYHVDYLIVDKKMAKPLVALELDGTSHKDAKRQKSDRFKEKLFQKNGLPLLRISRKESDIFSLDYYRKLLHDNPKISIYHYPCGQKMRYINGKYGYGSFYSCPACVREDGKPCTIRTEYIRFF